MVGMNWGKVLRGVILRRKDGWLGRRSSLDKPGEVLFR